MKKILFFLLLIPFLSLSQTINEVDTKGLKQGVWKKMHTNGNLRYSGQFKNDNPSGIFLYYYSSVELQV